MKFEEAMEILRRQREGCWQHETETYKKVFAVLDQVEVPLGLRKLPGAMILAATTQAPGEAKAGTVWCDVCMYRDAEESGHAHLRPSNVWAWWVMDTRGRSEEELRELDSESFVVEGYEEPVTGTFAEAFDVACKARDAYLLAHPNTEEPNA